MSIDDNSDNVDTLWYVYYKLGVFDLREVKLEWSDKI